MLNTAVWKSQAPMLIKFELSHPNSIFALSGPLTPNYPLDSSLKELLSPTNQSVPLILVNDLMVLCSLPAANRDVLTKLEQ